MTLSKKALFMRKQKMSTLSICLAKKGKKKKEKKRETCTYDFDNFESHKETINTIIMASH